MTRRTPPPLLSSILAATAELDARRSASPAGTGDEPSGPTVMLAVTLALLSVVGAGLCLVWVG